MNRKWQTHMLAAALETVASMATYEPVSGDDDLGNDAVVFRQHMSEIFADFLLEARIQPAQEPTFLAGTTGRAVVVLNWPRTRFYFMSLEDGSSHWLTVAGDERRSEAHTNALDAARAAWAKVGPEPDPSAERSAGADTQYHRGWAGVE
jgi:hypothetical protein